MSFLSALGDAVNPVKGIADAFATIWGTVKNELPAEKAAELELKIMAAQLEANKAEREYEAKIEELMVKDQESLRQQAIAEIQSNSRYISWARPSWMWGLLSVYVGNYFALPAVAWIFDRAYEIVEIPYEVHMLVGLLVGGMSYLRTLERMGKKPPSLGTK